MEANDKKQAINDEIVSNLHFARVINELKKQHSELHYDFTVLSLNYQDALQQILELREKYEKESIDEAAE